MKRLTRPAIKVDETVTKYLGTEIHLESINDRLLELILNGPTLMAVKKDVLRQLIRQLYGRLKAYEDIEMEPQDIEQTLMTGGRMSKTNYTVQAMISEANDHFEGICDECRERAANVVEVKHGRWKRSTLGCWPLVKRTGRRWTKKKSRRHKASGPFLLCS